MLGLEMKFFKASCQMMMPFWYWKVFVRRCCKGILLAMLLFSSEGLGTANTNPLAILLDRVLIALWRENVLNISMNMILRYTSLDGSELGSEKVSLLLVRGTFHPSMTSFSVAEKEFFTFCVHPNKCPGIDHGLQFYVRFSKNLSGKQIIRKFQKALSRPKFTS